MINYVKFQRGLKSAFENLSRKDADTLYFIYENEEAATGELWLGERLISSSSSSANLPQALLDLNSAIEAAKETEEGITTGSFLVAQNDGTWEVRSAEDVLELLNISIGENTLSIDENEFEWKNEDLNLLGFEEAENGSLLQKVDGKLGWFSQNSLQTLIEGTASQLGHLKYEKVASLEDLSSIELEDSENIVYLVPSEDGTESNQYDEYLVIDGQLEKIGEFKTDFSEYATVGDLNNLQTSVTSLETSVGNLTSVTNTLQEGLQAIPNTYLSISRYESEVGNINELICSEDNTKGTVISEINILNDRLTWKEIL